MIKLSYTQYARQFTCKIENINELSVQTLHDIEAFATARSGRVDYDKESFSIPKRIELHHLQELFKLKGMDVFISEEEPRKQKISQTATINFGKFKGQKWTDLEDEYLLWLSKNLNSEDKQVALSELESRKHAKVPATKRKETIMFGKHKGEAWEELPTPYLEWVFKNLKGESHNIASDILQRRK